jgi:hypothetical protein
VSAGLNTVPEVINPAFINVVMFDMEPPGRRFSVVPALQLP